MARQHITTEINGEPQDFLCDTEETLLDVLRDEFQLPERKKDVLQVIAGLAALWWTTDSYAHV